MNNKFTKYGLIAAAAMNIGGVLIFSVGFTNEAVVEADPVVMSNFGLLMISVWGMAYYAASRMCAPKHWLMAVFVIEKLIYVVVWLRWQIANDLGELFEKDVLAGTFYSIYGLNDFVFMLFFAWVGITEYRGSSEAASGQ